MAKIIAWLVLIFVVLLALRLVGARKARARRTAGAADPAPNSNAQPMVRCARCGVFLPQVEAKRIANGGFACADDQCVSH